MPIVGSINDRVFGDIMKPLRVGVIGANPDRGWALHAHLPALKSLPEYEVKAVSATKMASAKASAHLFDVPLAFDNNFDLVTHAEIDLVAITVKVEHHRILVNAAIDAGKHVYCEWPLGHGLAETEEMAALSKGSTVHAGIGLQGRSSPVINQLRDLIAGGYVGRVLSTSMVISAEHYLDVMPAELEVLLYPQFGTHLLTVQFSHAVDTLCYCLGEFKNLAATMATARPEVIIAETNRKVAASAPDHIAVSGLLESGATATIHMRGGHSRANNLFWEINGTEGDLLVTGEHGNIHIYPLSLSGGRHQDKVISNLQIKQKYCRVNSAVLGGASLNVAQAYVDLAHDIATGSKNCPDFEMAVIRHRMITAVQAAAETGVRQTYMRSAPRVPEIAAKLDSCG